ncbi:MAG: hypothetical protein AAF127_09380 [Pseudomonadota bacterium]
MAQKPSDNARGVSTISGFSTGNIDSAASLTAPQRYLWQKQLATLGKMSVLLEANDDAVDELFLLIENMEKETGASILSLDSECANDRLTLTYAERVTQARYILDRRSKQLEVLPPSLRSDAIIRILLSLLIDGADKEGVSSKMACLASGRPLTSALRLLEKLEEEKLIERVTAEHDRRVTTIKLTLAGVEMVKDLVEA